MDNEKLREPLAMAFDDIGAKYTANAVRGVCDDGQWSVKFLEAAIKHVVPAVKEALGVVVDAKTLEALNRYNALFPKKSNTTVRVFFDRSGYILDCEMNVLKTFGSEYESKTPLAAINSLLPSDWRDEGRAELEYLRGRIDALEAKMGGK